MTTHYIITTSKQAIGVTAESEAGAIAQAMAMGLGAVLDRIDLAMTEEEFQAAIAPRTAEEAETVLGRAELEIEGHDSLGFWVGQFYVCWDGQHEYTWQSDKTHEHHPVGRGDVIAALRFADIV